MTSWLLYMGLLVMLTGSISMLRPLEPSRSLRRASRPFTSRLLTRLRTVCD